MKQGYQEREPEGRSQKPEARMVRGAHSGGWLPRLRTSVARLACGRGTHHRRFAFALLPGCRQEDLEGCARAGSAVDLDKAFVAAYDALDGRQSETTARKF